LLDVIAAGGPTLLRLVTVILPAGLSTPGAVLPSAGIAGLAASRRPLPAVAASSYVVGMTEAPHRQSIGTSSPSRLGIALLTGGVVTLVLAGLLLWWREGDRLFTDGLIAAIVACF